jgi:hypothetical protein
VDVLNEKGVADSNLQFNRMNSGEDFLDLNKYSMNSFVYNAFHLGAVFPIYRNPATRHSCNLNTSKMELLPFN